MNRCLHFVLRSKNENNQATEISGDSVVKPTNTNFLLDGLMLAVYLFLFIIYTRIFFNVPFQKMFRNNNNDQDSLSDFFEKKDSR